MDSLLTSLFFVVFFGTAGLAQGAQCVPVCDNIGTKSEGWYNSCDGSLIQWARCGEATTQVCTMDAKICTDGSAVGRDPQNNCEFFACPPDDLAECSPYVCADGTQVARCTPDGTVINYFAAPCLTHGGEVLVGNAFSDVPSSHPNADAIAYVKAQGIVSGYSDGTFKPDQTINRAEFVKIVTGARKDIYLLENGQEPSWLSHCFDDPSTKPFSDITPDMWFGKYVCAASEVGTIGGYPDGTFRPSHTINFVESAKILGNAYGMGSLAIDAPAQDPWFKPYATALGDAHVIPTSINAFDQQITRGEMAEMIYRLQAGVTDKPSKTFDDLMHANLNAYSDKRVFFSFLYPSSWPAFAFAQGESGWGIWSKMSCDGCGVRKGDLGVDINPTTDAAARIKLQQLETSIESVSSLQVSSHDGYDVATWILPDYGMYTTDPPYTCTAMRALVIRGEQAVEIKGHCMGNDPGLAQAFNALVASVQFR